MRIERNNILSAVLFDMDGVLFDSEPIYQSIWIQTFKQFNLTIDMLDLSVLQKLKGLPLSIIKKNLDEEFIKMNLKIKFEEIFNKYLINIKIYIRDNTIPLIPGIIELLNHLKKNNVKLAIVSSSSVEMINLLVAKHNISSFFQEIAGIDLVKQGKPAPDIYLYAAHKLGTEPENCIVIEDSTNGIKAAIEAGMKCIGFNNHNDEDLSEANLIINNIDELNMTILEELCK